MIEQVAICDESFIAYRLKSAWYKIPFFVLEGLCHEWGNNHYISENARRHNHDMSGIDLEEGPFRELRKWLEKYTDHINLEYRYTCDRFAYSPRNPKESIAVFKEIMEEKLEGMEAYRLFT